MKFSKLAIATGALGLAGLTLMTSPLASADDKGWYGGVNLGQSSTRIDNQGISNGLHGEGITTTSIHDDDRDFGYKLFGGYQFNRHVALEGGYFDLGRFGFDANTTSGGTLKGNIRLKGLNTDLVGIFPITERFSALARLGLIYADGQDTFSGSGGLVTHDGHRSAYDFNVKVGVGVQYAVSPSVGLRAEAERYRVDDGVGDRGDVDLLSVGLVYRFGKVAPPVEPAPPVAAAPEAAPVVSPVLVIVPAPIVTQQYCTILDLQFDIDKDTIERQDAEKLSVVGTFMNKYPDTTAVIEGHSDDVGTDDYNMKLSQRRAEAVVAYLEESFHIAPTRLSAEGYGKARPVANNQTEAGKRRNRRIDAVIACATDTEGLAVAPARMTMALDMEFDRDKAEVRPEYDGSLRKVAAFLIANPNTTASVEGHTGNVSPETAMEVSQHRAQNVVDYLVNLGVARSRLTAEGFGDTSRFAYNTSKEGQQENRRVNIIINYAQ